MTKVWVVSILVVAAIAGGVLLLFGQGASRDGDAKQKLKPPRSLREEEVRHYMNIRPIEEQLFVAAAKAFGSNRPIDVRAELARILLRSHLTENDWATIRRRVEYVVGIQRYEGNKDKRTAAIEDWIRKRKIMLEGTKSKTLQKRIRTDIEFMQDKLRNVARPISDSDRALTRKFWATLSKLVPADQGPKMPGGSPPPKRK